MPALLEAFVSLGFVFFSHACCRSSACHSLGFRVIHCHAEHETPS